MICMKLDMNGFIWKFIMILVKQYIDIDAKISLLVI